MGEIIDKLKGKAKQVEGAVTGNRTRQAEGLIDELKGDAKGAFEELKHAVKKGAAETEEADIEDEEGK